MPRETLVNEMIDDMLDSIIIIKLNTYFNTKRQGQTYSFLLTDG